VCTQQNVPASGCTAYLCGFALSLARCSSPLRPRLRQAVCPPILVTFLWQDETERGTTFDIATDNKRVFAVGRAGDVVASPLSVRVYDAQKGNLLWHQLIEGETATAVTVSRERVIVSGRRGTGQTVRSLDRLSGVLLWQDEVTGAHADGKIAEVGGRVFIAGHVQNPTRHSLDFLVRAYDRKTGTLLWQDQAGGPGSGIQNEAWAWDVAAEASRVFAVGYGLAAREAGFGMAPFLVRAYDAVNGTFLWQDQSGDRGEARRVVAKGAFLSLGTLTLSGSHANGSFEPTTHGLAASSGNCATTMGVEFTDVAVAGKRVLVGGLKANTGGNVDFSVRAYGLSRGDFVWEDRIPGVGQTFASRVATAGGVAFAAGLFRDAVGSPGLLVRAYDADTGTVIWQDRIANSAPGGGGLGGLATAGSRLFAGGSGDLTFDVHGVPHSYFLIRAYDTR
jgi:outer membrane protein assembly factor BamB